MMQIDWAAFTPAAAAAGGLLIGVAASLLVLATGRVAGVSGIVGGLIRPGRGDVAWRLAFVAGMVAAPLAYHVFAELPPLRIDAGYPTLIFAGVLVGLGTRYAAGCTSGHGVCGVSRGSARSIAATVAFMIAGFLTVYLTRHAVAS